MEVAAIEAYTLGAGESGMTPESSHCLALDLLGADTDISPLVKFGRILQISI